MSDDEIFEGWDFDYDCMCGHRLIKHEVRTAGWAECTVCDCRQFVPALPGAEEHQ